MTKEELQTLLSDGLGLCGCSDDDGALEFLKELLEAGEMRDQGHEAESDALIDELLPEGDCLERNLPVYWLTSGGLIEHGWSLASYGLSDVGDAVLAGLREYGTGDDLWADEENGVVWN